MIHKTPFFITASLLAAALALALPGFDLDALGEEPVQGATIHGMAGAPHASSAPESKP